MALDIHPLSDALGAEVTGIDIRRPLKPDDAGAVRDAFLEHHLLCFRAAPVTALEFCAFARNFGEPQRQCIRRCRRDIMALARGGAAKMARLSERDSFFTTSECRDLLFHVREDRFTLPRIETALRTLGLDFLGFEFADQEAMRRFRSANPESPRRSPTGTASRPIIPKPSPACTNFGCKNLIPRSGHCLNAGTPTGPGAPTPEFPIHRACGGRATASG